MNENNIDSINTIAENISTLIAQKVNASIDEQLQNIPEIISEFTKILQSKISSAYKSEKIQKAMYETFSFIGNCIKSASSDLTEVHIDINDSFEKISTFLSKIIITRIANECFSSVVQLIAILLSIKLPINNENQKSLSLDSFIKPVEVFFKMQLFRYEILKSDIIEKIWKDFCENEIEQNILLPHAIDQMTKYASFYADNKVRKLLLPFLTTINATMPNLNQNKFIHTIDFLVELSKQDLKTFIAIYTKLGILNSLMTKVIENSNIEGENKALSAFILYGDSMPYLVQGKISPPLFMLLRIFTDEKCDNHIHQECLKFFLKIVSTAKSPQDIPFIASEVSSFAKSIAIDDHESIQLYSQFVTILYRRFTFDMVPIFPALINFCNNYKLMIDIDLTPFLTIFFEQKNSFSQFFESFAIPLLAKLNFEQTSKLFNKYRILYNIMVDNIDQVQNLKKTAALLGKFVSAYPYYEDKKTAKLAIKNAILFKKGFRFMDTVFSGVESTMKIEQKELEWTKDLFRLFIKCAKNNKTFSNECISQKVSQKIISFYSKYNFPSILIFNFISAIADHRYIPIFDANVSNKLKEENFLNESEENILDLTLGVQNGEDRNKGNLCFPSLVWKCPQYEFKYPFDLFLCSHISIDFWLKESNRPLSEFPSIVSIARQYMLPKHIRLLLNYPEVIEKVCRGVFAELPLFEFPSLNNEVQLVVPTIDINSVTNTPSKKNKNNKDNFIQALSFWFRFSSFTNDKDECLILNIGTAKLTATGNKLFFNGTSIGTIKQYQWNLIVITNSEDSKDKTIIYLNNENVLNDKYNKITNVIFGGKNSGSSWDISGGIAIYSVPLKEDQIRSIAYTFRTLNIENFPISNCIKLYSPNSIAPLFRPFDLNTIKAARPSIVYSFIDYIKKSDRGTNPLFIKATDMLHKKEYDKARSLIVSICQLHKKSVSFWTNKEFALNMSIICSYDTATVNDDLINIICSCFHDEQNKSFDWDNFFKFVLDYRFFNSQFQQTIYNLIKKYYECYPFESNSPLNSIISDFCLSLVILPDFKQENRKNVFDLIRFFVKNPTKILRYIISTPDFSENLVDYSTRYEFKNSETVEILLAIYFSLKLTKFKEYYVFSILEKKQCLMILDHIINSKLTQFIDDTSVLDFCMTNVSLIQAWEIALVLFLKKDISLRDNSENLDFSTFQMKYYGNFLHMATFLSFVAIRLSDDNLFYKLCCQILRGLDELVEQIENPKRYLKLILILMTLGDSITSRSNFPLSPKIETDQEIIKCSLSRGQAYPQNQPSPFKMEPVKLQITTADIPNLTQSLPQTYNLSETEEMPMDLRIKELSFVIMEKQLSSNEIDWNRALKYIYDEFEITNIKANYAGSKIVGLIIKFLVHIIMKFPTTIDTIMATHVYLEPDLSIFWVKEITLEILKQCNEKNILNQAILEYIIKRAREGWYSTIYVEVMKGIFEIIKNAESSAIPNSFYLYVWNSLDIVVPDNSTIAKLCRVLVENEKILMNSPVFENFTSIMSIIYRGIALIPFLPPFMSKFWLHLVNKIKTTDVFLSKMKKGYPQIDVQEIFKGLTILGQLGIEKYNAYKLSNIKLWTQFESILQSFWDTQRNIMEDKIKTDVDLFLNQYEKNGETFLTSTRKLLLKDLLHRCKSRAIACSVRYYTRRTLLLMIEHYLRLREYMIGKTFPFKDSSSPRYCLSLLSDPIYPTRRLTPSPIEYVMPSYPNGSSDELYNFVPTEEQKSFEFGPFPECVMEIICDCRFRGPTILNRIRYPMLAKYIPYVDNIPSTEYYLLFNVFNFTLPQNSDMHQNLVLYQQQQQQQQQSNTSQNISLSSTNNSEQNTQSQLLSDSQIQLQLQQQQQQAMQKKDWDQIISMQINTNQVIVNDPKENVIYICETSFLYGVDVLEGTAIFTNKNLYFFEGATIRGNCFHQFHSSENTISQEFYIQSILSGLFSSSVRTFRSHFVVVCELNQIISCTNHLWIQRPYSMTLNFSAGYTFVLIFKKATYDDAYALIKPGMDEFFEKAPPAVPHVRTPLFSARLILTKQVKSTQMWVDGDIDNYTYLCLVNRLAKRCFADLTQFPVFPWVISDYQSETISSYSKNSLRDLTKPMGQIGEERAERFDSVFVNSDPKYYYGTHYLHFGVVAYFMFRLDPYSIYSFILHHGWDHPQRIFFSILETWKSAAYDTPSDVKELIPQLFKVPEMLLNPNRFPLITNLNEDYTIVQLPKWAANARHFTHISSKVLELRITTKYLPNWIDLIFGYNSRGPGAISTKNIFHPTCYPDLTDLEDLDDQLQKQAMITSIINFGQCSPQIFTKIHPHQSELLFRRYHLFSKIGTIVYQKIKCDSTPISSIGIYQSEMIFIKDTNHAPHVILPGTTNVFCPHDDPTISNIAVSSDGLFMCRTYLDGHVMITRLEYSKNLTFPVETIIENFNTEIGVKRCVISSAHFLALVACGKNILQFDIGMKRRLPSVALKYNVKHIAIDEDAAVVWAIGVQKISLFSISMDLIIEDSMKTEITSICACPLPEHYENRFALIGHVDGTVSFIGFSYQTNKFTSLYRVKLADDPIVSVTIDPSGQRAAAATKFACYDFEYIDTKERPLNMKYALECCSCSAQLKNLSFCQRCNRFTCTKCLSRDPASGLKVCNNCKSQQQQ